MVEDFRGRVLGGQFIIGEFLDEGSYGMVFCARQFAPDREVVVKILRHRASGTARDNREAQVLAKVKHTNAVGVLASGIESDDGLMWIAMDLVPGTSLRAWFQTFGKMSLHDVVALIEPIADVVHTAHRRGIVHRDLKPENIMVTPREHEGKLKLTPTLLDFGIAKWLDDVSEASPELAKTMDDEDEPGESDSAVTSRGVVSTSRPTRARRQGSTPPIARYSVGTREYRAPEMWADPKGAGPPADVYAMGMIAYEALAGRRPFTGATKEEWRKAHQATPLEPIGESTPDVFDALLGALAKRPEDRPAPLEFAAALRAALVADPAEQIKTSARLWEARGRSPDLLWGPSAIAAVERRQQLAQDDVVSRAFLAASRRRVQARRWKVVAAALAVVVAGGAYREHKNGEASEARAVQAEVDQGSQFLLMGDAARAAEHLAEAYRRGDRSWSTEFMYARAGEPQLAEEARFQALKGRMWSTTYSPDGRQIVTTDEGGAQIWDARTFQRLYALPHPDIVYDAEYTSDGERLVTACGDGALRIWAASTGELVRELRSETRLAKLAVQDNAIAALDMEGRSVRVWSISSGATLFKSHGEHQSAFLSLAFSRDGRWLAAITGEDAYLIETATWKRGASLPGATRSLGWDPAGQRIATGSPSGDISIWDTAGQRLRRIRETGAAVDIVAFSPDGKLLGTAERDGTTRVWDAASGELRNQSTRAGRVRSMIFDAASAQMALGASDGSVRVLDALTGLTLAVLDGAQDAVWSIQFDASASRVIAASWDGSVRVWSARSPYRRSTSPMLADHCDVYNTAAPDGQYIIVGCNDRATRVWDTAHDRLLAELPAMPSKMTGDFAPVLPVVSADGSRAAIAHGDLAEIYELPGGRLLRSIDHNAQVTALAFGAAGELASGTADGALRLTTKDNSSVTLPAVSAGVDAVAVLDGGRVVAADAGGRLHLIAPDRTSVIEMPTRVTLLRPSPDGSRLVAIQDNTIPSLAGHGDPAILVDLRGGRVSVLAGHRGRVFNGRWVGGDRVLTTASDGTVRLWDGASGRQVRVFQAQARRFLADAAISRDGALLVAGGADGLVEFWDFATGRELWSLRAHSSHVVGLHFEGDDLLTRGFGGEIARWQFAPAPDVIRRMVSR